MADQAAAFGLIERDQELALLERAVAALAGFVGSVVVVEGAAGTGKSRLLAALADLAHCAGLPVVRGRAVDLDASLPFSVVRRLFEPSLRSAGRGSGADPRAERALNGLTMRLRRSTAPLADGGTAAIDAVVDGVEALADVVGPMVVTLDDGQWAD